MNREVALIDRERLHREFKNELAPCLRRRRGTERDIDPVWCYRAGGVIVLNGELDPFSWRALLWTSNNSTVASRDEASDRALVCCRRSR